MYPYSDAELESIIKQFSDTIYRTALIQMKSHDHADDIYQEVCMKLLNLKKKLQSEEHLKAWLIRTTICCCRDYWKSAWRRNVILAGMNSSEMHLAGISSSGIDSSKAHPAGISSSGIDSSKAHPADISSSEAYPAGIDSNEAHPAGMASSRKHLSSQKETGSNHPECGWVTQCVQNLPDKYRLVIHLYYYEEYSQKEIAQILHIKESSVSSRLTRGRSKLKKLLDQGGIIYEL